LYKTAAAIAGAAGAGCGPVEPDLEDLHCFAMKSGAGGSQADDNVIGVTQQ